VKIRFTEELYEGQYKTLLWMLGIATGEIARIDENRASECISIASRINAADLEFISVPESEV